MSPELPAMPEEFARRAFLRSGINTYTTVTVTWRLSNENGKVLFIDERTSFIHQSGRGRLPKWVAEIEAADKE